MDVTRPYDLCFVYSQLEKAYNDCSGHRGDLKTHLQDTAANLRKINQTMEHYGYITCTLTLQAARLREYCEMAAADIKKVELGRGLGGGEGRREGGTDLLRRWS